MADTERMLKEIEQVVQKHGATMAIDHIDAQKLSIKIAVPVVPREDAAPAGLGRQERERIALSKLDDRDKALLDNPYVLAVARSDNKSPAEVLVWLREGADDLAVKAFHDAHRPGAQRIQPKIYGRSLAE